MNSTFLHPSALPTRFLSSLIPENWTERIYEYKGFYFITVTGDKVTEEYFEALKERLSIEFGDNLEQIYEHPSDGIKFEVFLKKGEVSS